MLVLNRRQNEQIVIDGRIVVTVVRIRGDSVRFGIEAPKDVPVHRKEIHTAMKREEARTESSGESESTCSP
jgi:carbon storage regulator